jgi:hypothetical protein
MFIVMSLGSSSQFGNGVSINGLENDAIMLLLQVNKQTDLWVKELMDERLIFDTDTFINTSYDQRFSELEYGEW